MSSFEAIDPTKQPNFDDIVNRIVEDTMAAREERGIVASTSSWFVPVLLAASVAAVLLVRSETAAPRAELSEVIGIPHQVAQWARQNRPVQPSAVDVLQSFGRNL